MGTYSSKKITFFPKSQDFGVGVEGGCSYKVFFQGLPSSIESTVVSATVEQWTGLGIK